jgi:predicted nucleotidyltransferase component of viral defense system
LLKMNYQELYKIQDKVFTTLQGLLGPLYLTGGTALSRFYLQHRHSDDLVFFANNEDSFATLALKARNKLADTFNLSADKSLQSESFLRIWIEDLGQELKIEFVNDVAFRWGKSHLVSGIPVDNPGNILANKLTALVGRDEPKDVFDIIAIAGEYDFSWPEVFENALNKAIIAEPDVLMRLRTFPPEMILHQRWLSGDFNLEEFKFKLNIVCNDFLLARENSLGKLKKHITKAKPLMSVI